MSEKEIIVIDSQRLGSIMNCACKYDYVFNQKLIPGEQAFGIERGSLIHEGLDVYYTALMNKEAAPIDLKVLIPKCVEVMETKAISMAIPIESVEETIKVFKEYVEFYYHDDHRLYDVVAVEQVGSKVLFENDELIILYETKIDRITTMPRVGIMPWDVKTYSRKSPIHQLNNQFIGYCWMLDVRNIMIDRIGFQKTLKPAEKYVRVIKSYPLTLIEQWKANATWWILHLRNCQRTGIWPQNFTSCDKYNSECIFTSLCTSPVEIRGHKASQLFDIGQEWDVGAKL